MAMGTIRTSILASTIRATTGWGQTADFNYDGVVNAGGTTRYWDGRISINQGGGRAGQAELLIAGPARLESFQPNRPRFPEPGAFGIAGESQC